MHAYTAMACTSRTEVKSERVSRASDGSTSRPRAGQRRVHVSRQALQRTAVGTRVGTEVALGRGPASARAERRRDEKSREERRRAEGKLRRRRGCSAKVTMAGGGCWRGRRVSRGGCRLECYRVASVSPARCRGDEGGGSGCSGRGRGSLSSSMESATVHPLAATVQGLWRSARNAGAGGGSLAVRCDEGADRQQVSS
jgi:hypothetical protein